MSDQDPAPVAAPGQAQAPVAASTPYRFSVPVVVRFRDLDALGHVNHAVYFTYMEIARTEYWMQLVGEHRVSALHFIVAKATCDYRSAAALGETLDVSVRVPAIRKSSFDFDYELRDRAGGRLVAAGLTVQVYYDYRAGKSLPIPAALRERLETYERTGDLPPWGGPPA
ncbi:MAG: acyl-CoA thioesterase [Planctomycetes bacterium]|nr:acyl-CoA thioesterase [Planctomycetota bacterium]